MWSCFVSEKRVSVTLHTVMGHRTDAHGFAMQGRSGGERTVLVFRRSPLSLVPKLIQDEFSLSGCARPAFSAWRKRFLEGLGDRPETRNVSREPACTQTSPRSYPEIRQDPACGSGTNPLRSLPEVQFHCLRLSCFRLHLLGRFMF